MRRITQAFVGDSIKFFKDGFLDKYNLTEYHDPYQPAIFFGGIECSSLLPNHKSWKIILPSHPKDFPIIKDYTKTIFICSDNYTLPDNVIRKSLTPSIKDYSMFKPNILGDKIYFYSGFCNGWNLTSPFLKDIQSRIGFEIITTQHSNLKDYYSMDYLKSNFYDNSFLNLNFSGHGLASVIELGLMGRKTIFNPKVNNNIQRLEFTNNFINYENVEDIISIINIESEKIGTIQPSIDAHNIDDEWLDLDFWL